MNRNVIALSLGLLLGPTLAQGAIAQGALPAITEAEAHAIGVDAYLYFYPIISTEITRLTSTNIEADKEPLKGPMNTFVSAAAYPPGDLKLVVRINFDTLYSLAWLDLTNEPVVVSSPDTDGRYFLLPMLDMWTDVFASPGHADRVANPAERSRSSGPVCRSFASRLQWKIPTIARVANGWSMNTDTMGVYGNYYLKRAIAEIERIDGVLRQIRSEAHLCDAHDVRGGEPPGRGVQISSGPAVSAVQIR